MQLSKLVSDLFLKNYYFFYQSDHPKQGGFDISVVDEEWWNDERREE